MGPEFTSATFNTRATSKTYSIMVVQSARSAICRARGNPTPLPQEALKTINQIQMQPFRK